MEILLIGIILLIILFKIINGITKRIYKKLKAKNVDETILRVTTQSIKLVFKGIVLLCFIGYVGTDDASKFRISTARLRFTLLKIMTDTSLKILVILS